MDDEREDKRIKVSPDEILDELSYGEHKTVGELADKYEVCPETIRKKVRTLRQGDNPIIHGPNGYILINKDWLQDEGNAQELEAYQNWIIASLKGLHPLAHPVQPLLPQMRRTLAQNYSREERHKLMKDCARITALLAFSEVEEEQE